MQEKEIERFDWNRTARLAEEHHKPIDWVRRGFETARRIGVDPKYFVQKYTLKEETAVIPEFEVVFREVLREERENR